MSKLAEIEALLFVAGEDGLRVRQLAELLSMPPTGVTQSLEKLAEKYQKDEDSSLALLETSNTYKIVTKQDFAELLRKSIKVYQEPPWKLCPLLLISSLLREWKWMRFVGSILVVRFQSCRYLT